MNKVMDVDKFLKQETEWDLLSELGFSVRQHEKYGNSMGKYYCIKSVNDINRKIDDVPITRDGDYAVFTKVSSCEEDIKEEND